MFDIDKELHEAAKRSQGETVESRLKYQGDEAVRTDVQDIEPFLQLAFDERKHGDRGWTKGRKMRKVGSIPLVYAADPRYIGLLSDDRAVFKEAANRFFKDHPEFRYGK